MKIDKNINAHAKLCKIVPMKLLHF